MLLSKRLSVKRITFLRELLILPGFHSSAPFDSEKERENSELESLSTTANNALQVADTMLTNLKGQIKAKKDELRGVF